MCVLCQCYACVAIHLSDVNCTSKWVLHSDTFSKHGDMQHGINTTLVECQKACEFDPRCVAVDWSSYYRICHLNIELNHDHQSPNDRWYHYELVSRCNITLGQCFDSNFLANIEHTENYLKIAEIVIMISACIISQ